MNGCSFQQLLWQILIWPQHRKTLFLRVFILKPPERAQVLYKNSARYFQNSPSFERSACFYVTITANFERFQYINFKTFFLKNKNVFQKSGVRTVFQLKVVRLKRQCFSTELPFQKPVLRQIKDIIQGTLYNVFGQIEWGVLY